MSELVWMNPTWTRTASFSSKTCRNLLNQSSPGVGCSLQRFMAASSPLTTWHILWTTRVWLCFALYPHFDFRCLLRLQVWGEGAALSGHGGVRGLVPGPADPWHKAGSPVQCWYQHFGAGPEPQWQHDRWEQKPWTRTANPCAGAGWLPGVLWYRCKLFISWSKASLFLCHPHVFTVW